MANKKEEYELVIIGAGPGGMTAAIYAARYKIKTLIISKDVGGLGNEAHIVENWPGIIKIPGTELMQNFKKHVESLGVKIMQEEVDKLEKKNNSFQVTTANSKTFNAKTLILALGSVRRKLNIPGEAEFIGKGVSYCTTCDAPLFKDKTVCVVGGRNSAVMSAIVLAKYAKKVYIIYRRDALRAEPYLRDDLKNYKNIEIIYNAEVTKIEGTKFVEKITLKDGKEMPMEGVFIQVGQIPSTTLAKELNLKLNEKKSIITDKEMATNVPGVYAVGDIRDTPLKQIVTAAGDGATAAFSVFKYLKKGPSPH